MFLKFRYRLGYESLCREVADSITWRRFCRIGLDGAVPHPTTLMKLTTRCGSTAVDGLNEALLAKAAEAKVLRTNRVRADTTVVPANVSYPTDSGLLAKAIRRIGTTGQRIHAAGGAVRTTLRDRSRAAGSRAHGIAAKLRSRAQLGRDQVKDSVQRITGELADLAEAAARDAERLLVNARRALRRAQTKAAELAEAGFVMRPRDAVVVDWPAPCRTCPTCWMPPRGSSRRPGNGSPGSPRTVPPGWSACTTSRPARSRRAGSGNPSSSVTRGRLSTTTTASSLDHDVQAGNPPDAPQLAPAVQRVKARTGRAPRTVTADRGYGEAAVDQALADLGVRNVVIPRKGRPGADPAAGRTPPGVPPNRQMANRLRRPDQHPQTRIRLGPHPPGQPRRSENLDRTGDLHPQPDQDRRPHRLKTDPGKINNPENPQFIGPESRDRRHQRFSGRSS